jgi:ectoine hydroxylase-related dioxygenase (phytanoyl-CoA dioxygenase family)
MPDLSQDNQPLHDVLYDGPMMRIFETLLDAPVRHFDFTWVRAVAPKRGTPPHMDVVYMGRGTKQLYTAWTPMCDIPVSMGGLLVLEKSHKHQRLNEGYGSKDVDEFCENKVGPEYSDMGGGGNIRAGGWLSDDPVKLRNALGGRWLTADFAAGDVLLFSVYTVHTSLDNGSNRIRLSTDTRYQRADEPIDERWIGEHPIAHGKAGKRGKIC